MSKSFRSIAVILIALVIAASTYAFAAANTVDPSSAGDGYAAISGYTITNIHYTLATNPQNLASVSFTATPGAGAAAPASVQVQVVNSGTWFTCSLAAGTWTCPITGVTVLQADRLTVVAAQ